MTPEQTIAKLREALFFAREKLAAYRALHSGEYVGGIEYAQLIRRIDEAMNLDR